MKATPLVVRGAVRCGVVRPHLDGHAVLARPRRLHEADHHVVCVAWGRVGRWGGRGGLGSGCTQRGLAWRRSRLQAAAGACTGT
jgi:hypothetical protein